MLGSVSLAFDHPYCFVEIHGSFQLGICFDFFEITDTTMIFRLITVIRGWIFDIPSKFIAYRLKKDLHLFLYMCLTQLSYLDFGFYVKTPNFPLIPFQLTFFFLLWQVNEQFEQVQRGRKSVKFIGRWRRLVQRRLLV